MFDKETVDHKSPFIQNYTERLLTSFEESGRRVRLLGVEYLDAYFFALGVEQKEDKSQFVVFTNTLGEYSSNQKVREIVKIEDSVVTVDDKRFLITFSQDEGGYTSLSPKKLPDLDSN